LKRIIFGIFVLLGVLLLIKPARSREAIPPGRVEVRYWEKWSGKEADQMKQIVDEFNNTVGKEKGIWVSYLSMTAVDQKTLLATAAGVPPDIAGMWDTQVKQYAAMGALEPLDELAKAHGITRDDYKHVFWDGGCYEGHLYALPSTPGGVALHYNKLLFEKKNRSASRCWPGSRPPAANHCGAGSLFGSARHVGRESSPPQRRIPAAGTRLVAEPHATLVWRAGL